MNPIILDDLQFNQIFRDPLTGVFNRRYLWQFLQGMWHRAKENQQLLGVILIDIDHFKQCNDLYGYSVGDTLLQEFVKIIQKTISNTSIVCRFGGEEFLVFLPKTSLEESKQMAEQLRQEAKSLKIKECDWNLTISLGVAVCLPEAGLACEEVITGADYALIEAKNRGRDRVFGPIQCFIDSSEDSRIVYEPPIQSDYKTLYSHQKQAQSVTSEAYSNRRQVLIKDAGGRILEDLYATELETCQEYTLLEINLIDNSFNLLIKTSHDTTKNECLMVPHHFKAVREVIRTVAVLNSFSKEETNFWQLSHLLRWNYYPFEQQDTTAIVSERPTQICFDNQRQLHAIGKPAIQFADGYGLYFYHGVMLPEKYGKLHPKQWQSQWILEEENAELRRVLIREIGYDRICQELQATELNSWQEYTLVKIDRFIDIDNQPIYLLKMTCPSTGYIHALRVPPDIQTAREAIRWVNWGIDPKEFSVQT